MVNDSGTPSPEGSETIRVRIASDGTSLHYRHWEPEGVPRGWLILIHGIQSHSGWYTASCERLAQAGWNVRCPDRRGSGLNSTARGDAVHWQRLVNDVRHFLYDVQQERRESGGTAPLVLAGISWGAKLACYLARDHRSEVDGLILITPGIYPRISPGWLNQARIALARWLNIRDRRIPIPLNDPTLFTSLSEKQTWIRNDPLALHEMTLSFLYASQDLDHLAHTGPPFRMPVQLLLAEKDRIIDNQRTRDFLQRTANAGLSVKEYPHVQHTLELETCRDEYIQDMLAWLEELASGRGRSQVDAAFLSASSPDHSSPGKSTDEQLLENRSDSVDRTDNQRCLRAKR